MNTARANIYADWLEERGQKVAADMLRAEFPLPGALEEDWNRLLDALTPRGRKAVKRLRDGPGRWCGPDNYEKIVEPRDMLLAKEDLYMVRNCGRVTVNEVMATLVSEGFALPNEI